MTTQSPHLTDVHAASGARATLDVPILVAMSAVPSVRSLSITDRPSGTLVYVALEDPSQEPAAYARLALARDEIGSIPIKMITVSNDDWGRLSFSEDARLYYF